jgi:hypothetical protein
VGAIAGENARRVGALRREEPISRRAEDPEACGSFGREAEVEEEREGKVKVEKTLTEALAEGDPRGEKAQESRRP